MTDMREQHFELVPFRSGRRLCPNMEFGIIAKHLKMTSLLPAFDWFLPNVLALESWM